MQAFSEYIHKDSSFWAFVKFASENLGYTVRRKGVVKSYSPEELCSLCDKHNIPRDYQLITATAHYSKLRAGSIEPSRRKESYGCRICSL